MPEPPRDPASPATSDDPARTRGSLRALAAALVGLAILPYLNALNAGFVYDDAGLIRKHSVIQGEFNPVLAVSALYWEGREDTRLWRPFVTLSFAIDDAVADDSAGWMHAVNVLAHAVVTLLGWCFLRRLGAPGATAFIAAALFAVHPLHTEAVSWISGRAELFAALGVFTAALASLRPGAGALVLCAAATFFAAASKESAAVLPLFLAVLGAQRARPSFGPSAASAAGLVGYLGARWIALGSLAGPLVSATENAMVGTTLIERLPTVLDAAGRYVALLGWPRFLAVDYGPPVLGLVSGATGYSLLGGASAFGLIATLALRRHTRLALASAFALIFYAVASNLAVVIGTNFAERLFYLPSFGLLWIVAELGSAAVASRPGLRIGLAAVLILAIGAFGLRTFIRNFDYRDDLTLSSSALAVHPGSPKMLYNRARELSRLGRYEEAVAAARQAVAAGSSPSWTPVVLADALSALGRHDEAEAALRSALAERPLNLLPRLRWITLLDERGDPSAGDALAEEVVRLSGDPPSSDETTLLWARAARAAQSRGELELSVARWEAVLKRDPSDGNAWTQLGLSLYGLGRSPVSRSALERALDVEARNPEAANALAWLLLEAGQTARALELARAAVEINPSPAYRDTYARALEASGDCLQALDQATHAAASNEAEHVSYRDELRARCKPAVP